MLRNKASFYGAELLAPRPTTKLEDHPLSAVRDCLFNIFAATLHFGVRSSIRNLRKRHAVVTRTQSSRSNSLLTDSLTNLRYGIRLEKLIVTETVKNLLLLWKPKAHRPVLKQCQEQTVLIHMDVTPHSVPPYSVFILPSIYD
jgi:hypothetical protein